MQFQLFWMKLWNVLHKPAKRLYAAEKLSQLIVAFYEMELLFTRYKFNLCGTKQSTSKMFFFFCCKT